jgi:pimeloyl-ACP methyl ester carboxylesterase
MTLLMSLLCAVALLAGCQAVQRKALFYPTHHAGDNGLSKWSDAGVLLGFAREVAEPANVWLLLHGNGGQAADRAYALPAFSETDAVFVLEYPGYGLRPGKPGRRAFDAAALQGYEVLRRRFPGKPICVAGESIGSGPAAMLAKAATPPDKLVFIVPFDRLKAVAKDHFPHLPVSWLLAGTWDNVSALSGYQGPVEVFGAEADEVISVEHARALAVSLPQARFHLIAGGHNDWSRLSAVQIRNP